jgi:Flp pilus assembly pilin Flp
VLATTERRGSLPAGGVHDLGISMTFVRAFLQDDRGVSSTQLALMIGLSASAVLVAVRIAVAAVGQ